MAVLFPSEYTPAFSSPHTLSFMGRSYYGSSRESARREESRQYWEEKERKELEREKAITLVDNDCCLSITMETIQKKFHTWLLAKLRENYDDNGFGKTFNASMKKLLSEHIFYFFRREHLKVISRNSAILLVRNIEAKVSFEGCTRQWYVLLIKENQPYWQIPEEMFLAEFSVNHLDNIIIKKVYRKGPRKNLLDVTVVNSTNQHTKKISIDLLKNIPKPKALF